MALIKLLWNPDINFEEIYCAPDFATGAFLLNEEEVKESLKNGVGRACKLRAKVEFDSNDRCLIVTEIPYSVYTNTICGELEKILEGDDNPGIDRFNDLTGATPLIKIYLDKKANADKVIRFLYKNTSLQYHYGINMTMLENGRYPKVFTWKAALQAHLDHEKEVYTNGFIFDLDKIKTRLHIIEGLLKAISIIDQVIALIKSAADTKNASIGLQQEFGFTEAQAKAILDIKLARLAHLEISKLEKEKSDLEKEQTRIEEILANESLLKKEIEKGLREVANKFGDARRTKILNIENENDEPTEVKNLLVSLTNKNNVFITENSSLMIQKRGGVGNKFKLESGEFIINNAIVETSDLILFFTNKGNYYPCVAGELPIDEKTAVELLIDIKSYEKVCEMASFNKRNAKENIIFFTRNGLIKKSLLSEYNTKRSSGAKAIALDDGDEICSVICTNEEKVGMLSSDGQFIICETKDIRPIGRVSRGRIGMKLNTEDALISAKVIPNGTREIISVSGDGYIKKTSLSEFSITSLNTKGTKLQKLKDSTDFLVDFEPIKDEKEVVVVSTRSQIKLDINEVPSLGKNTFGNKSMKVGVKDNIIGISKF